MKRSTTEDAAFDHLIAGNRIINTHGDAAEAAAEYQKAADAFGEAREEASRAHDGAAYDRCATMEAQAKANVRRAKTNDW